MPTESTRFFDAFLGGLSSDTFYNNGSLTAYLNTAPENRSGDEANIVDDKIVSSLICALGYALGERQYNLIHAAGRRTDFTVQIPEYPRPCFVAESKNTTTTKLERHLPQLADYMRSRGATRGILVNGKRILSYELVGGSPIGTGDIHVGELVAKWRGESLLAGGEKGEAALDYSEKISLQAFWQRFRRDAFSGLSTLIDDLTLTPSGVPHALDGSTWPAESRIKIHKPDEAEFIENLINESRELIREIRYDIAAQVAVRLAEHEEYLRELDTRQTGTTTYTVEFKRLVSTLNQRLESWGVAQSLRASLRSWADSQFYGSYDPKVYLEIKTEATAAVREVAATLTGKKEKTKRQVDVHVKLVEEDINAVQNLIRSYHSHRKSLSIPYEQTIRVHGLYEQWREHVATLILRTNNSSMLIREFAAQTAYVLFVRMLMVRIVEDKGLMPRVFTNGGVALWFDKVEGQYLAYAQGRSTDYLLEMAYSSAQHIYAHYYSDKLVFDWYQPDRNLVVRLLHRLAGFDLSEIDRDVIGHIYGGYVEGEHKHESGMFYTPPSQVEYILDRVGYSGKDVLGQRLLDTACGSGAFLVSACRRQLEAYRNYYRELGKELEDLPPDQIQGVLNSIKDSLFGLELNPFACYLAETNLLIQTLDLFKIAHEQGSDAHIEMFHVYNTDTLRYETETLAVLESSLEFPANDLNVAEQIKSKLGNYAEGFDYVVGNPPYVRADEGGEGILQYREEIKKTHPLPNVRDVLTRKWDMFVPFVALGVYLLREKSGRLGMITSNAIEQVPYAAPLRRTLVDGATINEVSFFPQTFLFEDAQVENTIFCLTRTAPDIGHTVLRRWHTNAGASVEREERLNQLEFGEDIFRQNVLHEQYGDMTVLDEICYISVGMVLNSDDKRFPGEFIKDDLISNQQDATHPVSYIEGDLLDPYELSRLRYLEYGNGLRAPERIRRATFPELYDRPKLMRGRTSHAWMDRNTVLGEGWVYANHSVMMFVPWHELKGIMNRSLTKALQGKALDRETLEETSLRFKLEYLLAICNNAKARTILNSLMTSSRATELQPEDFKQLLIPNADLTVQTEISKLVNELLDLGEEFLAKRSAGWVIKTSESKVTAPPALEKYPTVRKLPLGTAKVAWGLVIDDPNAHLATVYRQGQAFFRNRVQAIHFNPPVSEAAAQWIARQFLAQRPDLSFQAAEAADFEIPASPAFAEEALTLAISEEEEVKRLVADFHEIRNEIDERINGLYDTRLISSENAELKEA